MSSTYTVSVFTPRRVLSPGLFDNEPWVYFERLPNPYVHPHHLLDWKSESAMPGVKELLDRRAGTHADRVHRRSAVPTLSGVRRAYVYHRFWPLALRASPTPSQPIS